MAMPIGYTVQVPMDFSSRAASDGQQDVGGSTVNFKSAGISTGVIIAAVIGLVVFFLFKK